MCVNCQHNLVLIVSANSMICVSTAITFASRNEAHVLILRHMQYFIEFQDAFRKRLVKNNTKKLRDALNALV